MLIGAFLQHLVSNAHGKELIVGKPAEPLPNTSAVKTDRRDVLSSSELLSNKILILSQIGFSDNFTSSC
jgi:hypothetical protein